MSKVDYDYEFDFRFLMRPIELFTSMLQDGQSKLIESAIRYKKNSARMKDATKRDLLVPKVAPVCPLHMHIHNLYTSSPPSLPHSTCAT